MELTLACSLNLSTGKAKIFSEMMFLYASLC